MGETLRTHNSGRETTLHIVRCLKMDMGMRVKRLASLLDREGSINDERQPVTVFMNGICGLVIPWLQ